MRRILTLLVATALTILLAGAAGTERSQSRPGPQLAATDLLDRSRTFEVPVNPREAASMLVEMASDRKTGVAGVREILTRAGVPIIDTQGTALNRPAIPTKLGIHVYDFQVERLAASLQDGQTVSLARVAELAPTVVGVDLPEEVLRQAVDAWLESAPDNPENPEAFDAAIIAEFRARAGTDETAAQRLTLISYLLLSADLYGGKGVPRSRAAEISWLRRFEPVSRAYAADVPCDEEDYDPYEGAATEGSVKLVDWAFQFLNDYMGKEGPGWARQPKSVTDKLAGANKWWDRGNDAKDAMELLSSMLARAVLVAALKVKVENDASTPPPHRKHARQYPVFVDFRATVRFETPFPGAKVICGPLKNYTIPDNSPVSGIWVRWEIIGDGIQTVAGASEALSRSGGGGGYTDDQGTSKLRTETTFERGCPNDDDICAKGDLRKKNSGAKAWLDLTRTPPIKIEDLLMGPNPWKDAGKASIQVLMALITDIATSARGSTSMVAIEYHARPDHVLTYEGIVEVRGTCAGGSLAVDGTMATTLELRPDGSNSGSFKAEGVLDPYEPWSYSLTGAVCRITPKQPAISAELTEDGRLFIKLEDLESDSWACTPGPSGHAWWWLAYTLAMPDYRANDQAHRGWFELTPNAAKGKSGTRERTFKVIRDLGCQTDTVTTKIKLEAGT